MSDLLLRAARGERTERPPVWIMRQAGRHIPEYRALRKEYSFLEAIKTPEVAERISLLPWDLYRPDGVVMFSDILTVLEPLGFDYHIESGTGPVVENPVKGPEDVARSHESVETELEYVGALLRRLERSVGDETTIIGFAGGPFTLASYVVAGGVDHRHNEIRRFRARHPEAFRDLLESFADVVVNYLQYQVREGADVVQLFDTYASILPPADYREFVQPLHERILDSVSVPTIVFVRNMAGHLDLLAETGADVIGLDWTVDMADARERLGDVPVQGNLDPQHLFGEKPFVRERTRELVEAAGPSGHILNLGHGISKDTPVENVQAFFETAREISR